MRRDDRLADLRGTRVVLDARDRSVGVRRIDVERHDRGHRRHRRGRHGQLGDRRDVHARRRRAGLVDLIGGAFVREEGPALQHHVALGRVGREEVRAGVLVEEAEQRDVARVRRRWRVVRRALEREHRVGHQDEVLLGLRLRVEVRARPRVVEAVDGELAGLRRRVGVVRGPLVGELRVADEDEIALRDVDRVEVRPGLRVVEPEHRRRQLRLRGAGERGERERGESDAMARECAKTAPGCIRLTHRFGPPLPFSPPGGSDARPDPGPIIPSA